MSSFQNGTYGFGTVLTADRETLDSEQPSKKARVLPPATSANDAIQFHFVDSWKQMPSKQQDLDRETGNPPLFTNQVFEEEEIQGYQGLSIDVVLDLQQYIPRMFHKHSFKAEKRADDCVSLIGAHFTEGLPTDQAACAAMHEKGPTLEDAVKGSDTVHQFTQDLGEEKAVDFRVLHSIPATASEALRTLHARIHPLLMFYIDACSGLQQDDANMNLLLLVKYSEDKPVAVLGMLTYFVMYAFPTGKRFRVAQILIMPPFQRQGLAREMLTAVSKMAQDGVADIAFEDAAEPLQALRERMDAEAAVAIPEVWDRAQESVRAACKAMASEGTEHTQPSGSSAAAGASGSAGGASTSKGVDDDNEDDGGLGAKQSAALEAMEVGKETACILRKQLKLVPQQVQVVWDVLLWAAAVRCKICSQDDVTDLLQARVTKRELMDVAEQLAKGPAEGSDVPPNKVVLDGDVLEALEEEAMERDNVVWQEKLREQSTGQENMEVETTEAAEAKTDEKADPKASSTPSAQAAGEAKEAEGEQKQDDDEAPTVGQLTYVMFRADRRSKAARKQQGMRALPAVDWAALNDEAKESIVEIVNERRETVERIVHGMRWP